MAQACRGPGLPPEPLDELAVPVERGRQDLDRHPATELPVEPLVDPCHPTLASHRAELVPVDEDVRRPGLRHGPGLTHGPPPVRVAPRRSTGAPAPATSGPEEPFSCPSTSGGVYVR